MTLLSASGIVSMLTTIGGQAQPTSGVFQGILPIGTGEMLFHDSGRDDTIGTPLPPSQKLSRKGILKDIFWPVTAGNHTISISVRYSPAGASPPRLIVKANRDAGLLADVIGVAGSGGDAWVTIGPLNVTVTGTTTLIVWRERRHTEENGTCNWDNLQVT